MFSPPRENVGSAGHVATARPARAPAATARARPWAAVGGAPRLAGAPSRRAAADRGAAARVGVEHARIQPGRAADHKPGMIPGHMRAVTFQAPFEVRVDERPDPELTARDDAIVRIEASGICGSDLHIYHGRVKIEAGFTIGHEFVGTVLAAGDGVSRVQPGDRVLGCFHSACGTCFYCLKGIYQKCDIARVFGHGELLGNLPGTQADQTLVPNANLTLRKVPDDVADDTALFAGDVMGTAYHAVSEGNVRPGDSVAILGLGPVGLCAVQVAIAAGARPVLAIDTVEQRLKIADSFGATPIHLTEQDPRKAIQAATDRRGVDAAIDAVGHHDALDLAIRVARKGGTVVAIGVYAEPCELHMGLIWIKSLTLKAGQANVIGHVDSVLRMLAAGTLDPSPLVTHHMPLDDAPTGYEVYDRREALKIVLTT
jgi:2-desacetyl-2-hydroxyethyl bacteriochlorophyllide A dehydrogenase